jgi:CRP/FNR family transcriptional regulator
MTDALVKSLALLPYFDTWDESRLQALAVECRLHVFALGEIIFLEGEPSAGMWLIEQGRVKIYKISPEGEEHILRLLGQGNTFNDISAFDGGPNPANAAALTQVRLWLLPTLALQQRLIADNALALKVIHLLAGRVRALVSQVEDLALYSVTIRLARFLLKQSENPALSGPGITRAAIAAHLATKPETISRALRTLEKAEAIRFDRHRIIIIREDVLRTIAAL